MAALALAAALLPWWLGVALRPMARARGLTFERYERLGYARFQLTGVQLAAPGVRVTIARVAMDTPVRWIWGMVRGSGAGVEAEDWGVEARPAPGPSGAGPGEKIDGPPTLYARLQRVTAALTRWVPLGIARRGVVRWPNGSLAVDEAEWRNGRLTVRGVNLAGNRFDATVVPGDGWSASVRSADAGGLARAELNWKDADVSGTASVDAQPVRLAAHFPPHGWVPEDASLAASDWDVPAARVKLDAGYGRVRGQGRLTWSNGRFDLSIEARAAPGDGGGAPPVELRAGLRGDHRDVTVSELHLVAPFAQIDLTAPVTFAYDGHLKSGAARLSLRADLAKLPWIDAHGTLQGALVLAEPAGGAQSFSLECGDVRLGDFVIRRGSIKGALRWPRLMVDELDLRLDATNHIAAHGALDLATRELSEVAFQAEVSAAWFRRWLPRGWDWERAEATGTVSGPLRSPRHEGRATLARAQIPGCRPIDVSLAWRGAGLAADDVTMQATTGTATLHLEGSFDRQHASLRGLQLASGPRETWKLAGPATIAWAPAWRIEGMRLQGPEGGSVVAELAALPDPSFRIEAANVNPSAWQDWVVWRGPAWTVTRIEATGHLEAGRLVFAAQAMAQLPLKPQAATLQLNASGDATGIRLDDLTVADGGRVIAHANGHLPIGWDLTANPRWRLDLDSPLALEARIEPDAAFWEPLLSRWGVVVTAPSAHIQVSGTLRKPVGQMDVSVAHLGLAGGPAQPILPNLDDLVLHLRADRNAATLDSLAAKIEGQDLRAAGRVPMDDGRWQMLARRPAALDWSRVEARVEIPDADLAAVARRLAVLPLIQGRLRAAVQRTGDGTLTGDVHLHDGVSRPVEPLGVVQAIHGDLVLTGRTLAVHEFGATLGGEPVTLGGNVTFPAHGDPRIALQLKGANLPIVRRAGLLLRTDLDLRADTDAGGGTRVTGAVTLRDCLVLADLRELLPIGQAGVTRQPPYFAVSVQPFGRWQLAIEVHGPRSVRVRTPVFIGTASPRFQLGGTLAEPRAVGEITVDQGQVFFPFATFQVQIGAIRLPESDPYHPQLTLNAVSNRQDYQLRLAASGPPDAPNIIFSSNPPLEASQVLLLVTTGQPPTNERVGTTDQQRLARLGTYLGKGLFGGLSGGDEGRLELTAGNQTSRQGRDTYEVDYRLSDRWSLVGEYDEFDDYNAGLKWRIYSDEGGEREKK